MSKINETDSTNCKEEKELTLSKYTPSLSPSRARTSSTMGDFTIVNTEKFGRRIIIAQKILEQIGDPSTLQFSFSDSCVIFGKTLGQEGNDFLVKKSGKKGIIYSGPLTVEISKKFGLDFSERTSITFSVKIKTLYGEKVARVKITQKEEQ